MDKDKEYRKKLDDWYKNLLFYDRYKELEAVDFMALHSPTLWGTDSLKHHFLKNKNVYITKVEISNEDIEISDVVIIQNLNIEGLSRELLIIVPNKGKAFILAEMTYNVPLEINKRGIPCHDLTFLEVTNQNTFNQILEILMLKRNNPYGHFHHADEKLIYSQVFKPLLKPFCTNNYAKKKLNTYLKSREETKEDIYDLKSPDHCVKVERVQDDYGNFQNNLIEFNYHNCIEGDIIAFYKKSKLNDTFELQDYFYLRVKTKDGQINDYPLAVKYKYLFGKTEIKSEKELLDVYYNCFNHFGSYFKEKNIDDYDLNIIAIGIMLNDVQINTLKTLLDQKFERFDDDTIELLSLDSNKLEKKKKDWKGILRILEKFNQKGLSGFSPKTTYDDLTIKQDIIADNKKQEVLETADNFKNEKKEKEEKRKKVEEDLKKLLKQLDTVIKMKNELNDTIIKIPRVSLSEQDFLIQVDNHKEINPIFVDYLQCIDLAMVDFTNVKVSDLNFKDTNAKIDPQTVYNKDMSNGNYEGLSFPFKSFANVDITNSTFSQDDFTKDMFINLNGAIVDNKHKRF